VNIQFSQQSFVEEAVFSPTYAFSFFVKKSDGYTVQVYFWIFYPSPLVYLFYHSQNSHHQENKEKQILARMWTERNPYILLVECESVKLL
jgi:hypothetical protein